MSIGQYDTQYLSYHQNTKWLVTFCELCISPLNFVGGWLHDTAGRRLVAANSHIATSTDAYTGTPFSLAPSDPGMHWLPQPSPKTTP